MISIRTSLLAIAIFPVLAACNVDGTDSSSSPSASESTVSTDPAITRDSATQALAGTNVSGTDCRDLAGVVNPIAVAHLDANGAEDMSLTQTAGAAKVFFYGQPGDDRLAPATFVATIVGKGPMGEPLGNHNMLFSDGALRTLDDHNYLTPTSDPCVFDVKATLNFHDGSGVYTGLSGSGVANGKVNFCGPPGQIYVYARLCKAS